MKVVLVSTTDDPIDSLEHHVAIAADPTFEIRVLPTFRPDRAMAIEIPESFNHYVDRLAEVSGVDISDALPRFLDALRGRHDFFHSAGCRLSDHGMEAFDTVDGTAQEATGVFARVRRGIQPTPEERAQFRAAMLYEMALWDHQRGWTQQFHIGAMRNNNTRMFHKCGADTGFDSIGDLACARGLSLFLDRLDRTDQLAKTVLYNLNPAQNEVLATMIGNFQDGEVPGKIQFGSGWWFMDQKDGMEKQINCLSNLGLLSCFVGMLTDSRSFLSYARHEYFRRILCNILGIDMQQGLLPDDADLVGELVRNVCYENASRYFGFWPGRNQLRLSQIGRP
jgi:glucuronate isomerase